MVNNTELPSLGSDCGHSAGNFIENTAKRAKRFNCFARMRCRIAGTRPDVSARAALWDAETAPVSVLQDILWVRIPGKSMSSHDLTIDGPAFGRP